MTCFAAFARYQMREKEANRQGGARRGPAFPCRPKGAGLNKISMRQASETWKGMR